LPDIGDVKPPRFAGTHNPLDSGLPGTKDER